MAFSEARDRAFQMFLDAFSGLDDLDEPTIEQLREWDDALFNSFATSDATVTEVDAGGVPSLWVDVPGADPTRVLVWFHGGGYTLGSASGRRGVAADVARVAGCRALVVDYRLAPEYPYPSAVDDANAVYRWLLGSFDASRVVLAGDSAGGGLAAVTLQVVKDHGLPQPAAAVLVAPLVDFALSGDSHRLNKDLDPICSEVGLRRVRDAYLGAVEPTEPLASPLYGDLAGTAPTMIVVGSSEALLDDSRMYAQRATEAGVTVDLRVYEDMFHLFPLFASVLPEGAQAVAEMGDWTRQHTT